MSMTIAAGLWGGTLIPQLAERKNSLASSVVLDGFKIDIDELFKQQY
jgi:hypothetical protein